MSDVAAQAASVPVRRERAARQPWCAVSPIARQPGRPHAARLAAAPSCDRVNMLLITAEAGSHQAALPWRILPVIAADSLARRSTRPGIDGALRAPDACAAP